MLRISFFVRQIFLYGLLLVNFSNKQYYKSIIWGYFLVFYSWIQIFCSEANLKLRPYVRLSLYRYGKSNTATGNIIIFVAKLLLNIVHRVCMFVLKPNNLKIMSIYCLKAFKNYGLSILFFLVSLRSTLLMYDLADRVFNGYYFEI